MARHVIQIPINKSSNNDHLLVGDFMVHIDRMDVARVSEYLYLGQNSNVGLAWDGSGVPTNKKIISIELCLYSNSSFSTPVSIRYTDFGEGSDITFPNPADKSISGISSGWNYISIPYPIPTNSVVLGAKYGTYEYRDYVRFNSHRNSSNKPYLKVTYDDIPPEKPTSLYPAGITVSTRDIIRFSWLHNSKENLQQKGFNLQYSINSGSTWTTVSQTTPNQFYDMSANTLPTNGSVLWRVMTVDGNDEVSPYSTDSFTLGIVPQKAPIPISPISQYIDENNPIKFEWNFVGGSQGETQSKFELQYSTNGGSSWTTKTITSVDTFYELAAKTFAGGNITWRVRTYNNWNEVSPYSENRSFTVIGSPPIPQIVSVTNKSRPTINWQATGQHIYELQILKDGKVIIETGSIPSINIRSFKVKNYLLDGNYLAKLRILNEYNLHSPWAEKSFTISTVKPLKPIVDIYSSEYSITIKTSNTSLKTLVYRDNILIGEVINNSFTDYTGENNKEYKYFVRTLDIDENFTDSDIKLAGCRFSGNTLAVANNPADFIKLKYGLNSRPTKSNQFSVAAIIQNYDGREYPVTEYSEFSNRSKSLTFYLQTRKDLLKFIDMIEQRKTFLFRNRDGDNIYGTILNIDFDENETFWGYETGFSIVKTDYKGVVYD